MSFAYQLLYLLDATGFYSLGLHALGIHVCRATGQELMDTCSRISKIRSNERERLHGPPWLKALQRALLSCTYTMLDYAQTGLIAAVFFFKMMEWWYQSAEERMSAPTVYPPPPPPPAPKPDILLMESLTETHHATTLMASIRVPSAGAFKHLKLSGGESHLVRHDMDLNYVSKRRVPNGPDPIHNRKTVQSRQPPGRS
ncbi:hypothetical protein OIU76_028336 [Salix suchowensis]|nr:hypothetical protein OIU76_028336 [Salix suchowensis]